MEEVITPIKRSSPFYKRIALIDFLRGLFLCLVFIDHICWDMAYFFPTWYRATGIEALNTLGSFASTYWHHPLRLVAQFIGLTMFVYLSGISCTFSKSNTKRAVRMVGVFIAVSVITNLANSFMPSGSVINFNIIGVIAISVLIYCFIEHKSMKVFAATWLGLFLFYIVILPILYQYFGSGPGLVWIFWTPNSITVNGYAYNQADYMSLFPYILFFFLGVFIGRTYYANHKHLGRHYQWQKPICFLGRHSLIFYLAHQLVFYGLFYLIQILVIGI